MRRKFHHPAVGKLVTFTISFGLTRNPLGVGSGQQLSHFGVGYHRIVDGYFENPSPGFSEPFNALEGIFFCNDFLTPSPLSKHFQPECQVGSSVSRQGIFFFEESGDVGGYPLTTAFAKATAGKTVGRRHW